MYGKDEFSGKISSAGVDAKTGTPSPETAVNVAIEYSIDLSKHTSQKIMPEQLSETDMIICMEYWHLEFIKSNYPEVSDKLFLLSQFDPAFATLPSYLKYHIPDPYGKSGEHFHTAYKRIISCIDALRNNLKPF